MGTDYLQEYLLIFWDWMDGIESEDERECSSEEFVEAFVKRYPFQPEYLNLTQEWT